MNVNAYNSIHMYEHAAHIHIYIYLTQRRLGLPCSPSESNEPLWSVIV